VAGKTIHNKGTMSVQKLFFASVLILLVLVLFPASSHANTNWWHEGWIHRSPITLSSTTGSDALVKVSLNLKTLQQQANLTKAVQLQSLRVIDQQSQSVLTSQVVSTNETTGATELLVYVPGQFSTTLPYLYFDTHQGTSPLPQIPSLVTHQTEANYQGQEALMIETPRSTYAFQTKAGGLASLIDKENKDWISFNRTAGSAGMYRGIPNLVHPGDIFHPGHSNADTTITKTGPLFIELTSTALSGSWETMWYFYPTSAHLKVTKTQAGAKYWFLYEGTPGGTISSTAGAMDKYVLSNGTSFNLTAIKEGDLPDPEWLYFQDHALNRSLYFVHHQADTHPDRYSLMDNNMTVFGFGRGTGTTKYLTGTNSFTFGLVENKQHTTVSQAVTQHLNQPIGQLGTIEHATNPTVNISPTPTMGSWDLNNNGKVDIFDWSHFVKGFGAAFSIQDIAKFISAFKP
jgi:hypothetical protein